MPVNEGLFWRRCELTLFDQSVHEDPAKNSYSSNHEVGEVVAASNLCVIDVHSARGATMSIAAAVAAW